MSKADPDRVPTYEESQVAAAHPTPLAQQLITARTQHIDNLLARTGLLPRLAARVAAGWHLATFVLIPADSGAALSAADLAAAELAPSEGKASAPSDEQALELPSAVASVQDLLPRDDPATVLQLVCADPPGGFWRQTGAAPALGRVLRSRLRADGHAVEDPLALVPGPVGPLPNGGSATLSRPRAVPASRSYWRRMAAAGGDQRDAGVGVLHRPAKPLAGVRPGHMRVEVEARDVAVRVCSAMGLWETRAGGALVVRMEFGQKEGG